MGTRRFAMLYYRHARAMHRVSADRRIYQTVFFNFTQNKRKIVALDSALLQLFDQIKLYFDCFGNNQQTGSIFIQSVHNTARGT